MADTAVAITAGTGTNIDTRTEATNGNHRQVVVLGDPDTNAGVAPVSATQGLGVNIISGGIASGAVASGAFASGSIASGAIAAGAIAAGATSIAANEDDASADGDRGVKVLARRTAAPANTSGSDLDYEMLQMLAGRLYVRGEPRMFQAVGATLTRPANTTAYSANDAVSNNATAGSVTAQSVTVGDTNDDPISISRIRLASTDTGFAGKYVRVYVFNSDPTASTGVGGGDNAAWSQKLAGFIGSFSGYMRSFSDGCVGCLVPDEGNFVVALPVSGAKTLYTLLQTIDAATPSANSTTFIATLEGIQGRA